MTDIQFGNSGNSSNGLHIVIMQTVSGIDFQTKIDTQRNGFLDSGKLFCLRLWRMRIGKTAGMNLDNRRARARSRINLQRIGIDE